jgi:hypothetical protein
MVSGLMATVTLQAADPIQSNYNLSLSEDQRTVILDGYIDFGITRDLAALLDQQSNAKHLQLHSPGGRISEARGLVTVIERFGLSTSALGDCTSACTLAFIAGHSRYLEPDARLGFHRYAQRSGVMEFLMKQDPADEQQRDMAIFHRAQVEQAFLDRIMATPHQSMWFPTNRELRDAGVVTVVGVPN